MGCVMGAGVVLVLVVDIKAEDPVDGEGIFESEVGYELATGIDCAVCGGVSAV